MNVLNKVTLQSLKKNKIRTIVTIIGIVLSAAMICAVTSFVSSFWNYALQSTIYYYGDWHGSELNADYALYEDIAASDRVENTIYMQQLGYAMAEGCQNEFKPYLYVLGAPLGVENALPIHLTAGKYPASAQEILLPDHLYTNGGVKYTLGDTLTLELGERILDGYPMHQNNPFYTYINGDEVPNNEELRIRETRTYTVVGFYERPNFEEYTAPGYTAITLADESSSANLPCDIYFKMERPKEIYDFMEEKDLTGRRNTDVLMFQGVSRYNSFETVLYSLAAIVIGLIMFGSISLIYNAFSISVSERTRQFGLLSSVGATKKQLGRMVLFEALVVSVIGIPIGIITGVAGIGITLVLMGHKFQSLGFPMDMELSVSPISLLIAALVALVTVLISAWIPSRRATRVSAVEAIRQTRDINIKGRTVRTSKLIYRLFGLPGMLANKHYKRSKKKYRATVISLFMSIVLFVSASAFTDYLMESVAGSFSTNTYDLKFACGEDQFTDVSRDELLELLRRDTAVTHAAYVQYRSLPAEVDKHYLSKEALNHLDLLALQPEEETSLATLNIYICFMDDSSYKEILNQYNLEEETFMNPEDPVGLVFDGITKFDFQNQKYITLNILNGDACQATLSTVQDTDHSKEDAHVTIAIKSGKTIYENPYFLDQNIGVTFVYSDSMKSAVLRDVDMSTYSYQYLLTSEDHSKSYEAARETLHENGFNTSNLYNYAEMVESNRNIVLIIQVFSYGFIVLISLIAAANVFNTISTNISLRRREFAMLKSVGMTTGGFNRMMNFECLLYGSRALLYGLPVSAGVTYLIYLAISDGYESDFHLPWGAIGMAVLSVFTVVFITMAYSMRKIKKDNPIDALKNENL